MMKIVALTLCLALAASAQYYDDSDFDFGYDNGGVLGGWGHPAYSTISYGGGYRPYFSKGYGGYAKGYGGYKSFGGSYAPIVNYKSYGYGKGKSIGYY